MLVPAKSDLRQDREAGVSLWYIAMRAGLLERSDQWVLNYVGRLVENEHFPSPLPYYGLNATRRTGIGFWSRWPRPAVDAWFDGFLPPHLVPVAEAARSNRDAERLDQRAGQLAGAVGSAR